MPGSTKGDFNLGEAVALVFVVLPDDVLITCDASNFAGWLNRHFVCPGFRSLLGPINGAMG